MPISNSLIERPNGLAIKDKTAAVPELPLETWALIADHAPADVYVKLRAVSPWLQKITLLAPQLQHQISKLKPYAPASLRNPGPYNKQFEEERQQKLAAEFKETVIMHANYASGHMVAEPAREVSDVAILDILFSHTGAYMMMTDEDDYLHLLRNGGLADPELIYGEDHEGIETGVFAPSEDRLVTISKSGTLRFLSLNADGSSRTSAIPNACPQDKGWAVSLGCSSEKGSTLIALSRGVVVEIAQTPIPGGCSNPARTWEKKELINSVNNGVTDDDEHEGDAFYWAEFSRDGALLATQSADGDSLRLWDLQSESISSRTLTADGGLSSCDFKFSDDGRFLAGVISNTEICVWCTRSGKQIFNLQGDGQDLSVLCFSPDSQFLATGSREGQASVWDLRDREQPRVIKLKGVQQTETLDDQVTARLSITKISFRPDGRYLSLIFDDRLMQMCDFSQLAPRATDSTLARENSSATLQN
jgi:WD40 repeat protein